MSSNPPSGWMLATAPTERSRTMIMHAARSGVNGDALSRMALKESQSHAWYNSNL